MPDNTTAPSIRRRHDELRMLFDWLIIGR